MPTTGTQLVWLRNDLRWADNPALHKAYQSATAKKQQLRLIYCLTPEQWRLHNDADCKLAFRAQQISKMQTQAQAADICLDFIICKNFEQTPQAILGYCQQHKVETLFYNLEYPVDEKKRDQAVSALLQEHSIQSQTYCADLLVPLTLCNQQGQPYRTFSPWLKAWRQSLYKQLHSGQLDCLPNPLNTKNSKNNQNNTRPKPIFFTAKSRFNSDEKKLLDLFLDSGDEHFRSDLWPACETAAQTRLSEYCMSKVLDYEMARDLPSINGTSTLSPYLAAGILSPKQCLQQLLIQQPEILLENCQWLSELAWREFYRYLSWHWPHISYGHNFKSGVNTNQLKTPNSMHIAWQEGNTGIPIIDAAMQQLLKTGWMHNRLRMLTANYYCHILGGDWHHGEAFFMQHLIDGDYAANNGGWQWCAASGCDASPWPRIFNPYQQSKKFDPDAKFIKKMLPNLESIAAKEFYKEQDFSQSVACYSKPLVSYKTGRQNALDQLKGQI